MGLPLALFVGLLLPLVDPFALPPFEGSLTFNLGSLLSSLEFAPLFLDPFPVSMRPSSLSL